MVHSVSRGVAFIILATYLVMQNAWATPSQTPMDMGSDRSMQNSDAPVQSPAKSSAMNEMDMADEMHGNLGGSPMSREASGTSWQPESSPDQGLMIEDDNWVYMAQGSIQGIYDNQGGPRGSDKTFSSSMAMGMAQHPVGDQGTLGLRAMISLDPLMGPQGYPLLFGTGETANGRDPLIDRQHPHDLFMELAGSYSYQISDNQSLFFYAGLPGEPALGPPTFMHRLSGMDNPEAPITHHWLDSTHISEGVVTLGTTYRNWKLDASTFRGREPDAKRYDIEQPKLDSASIRLTFNPHPDWSFEASYGYIKSPEQLSPLTDEQRTILSAEYNKHFNANNWATTFAWGQKNNRPGRSLDGFLLESALVLNNTHTFFGRAERVDEDELLYNIPALQNQSVTVNKISLGYIRDFPVADHLKYGVGGLVSRYAYPRVINSVYGSNPTSFMLFMRLSLL